VRTGQIDEVRRTLSSSPELIHVVGPHPVWGGRPQALHMAVESGRRDMVALLLDAGADVNGVNDQYDGWSPVMLAAHRGGDEIRDELLRRGARVGLVEALMLADDPRVARLLEEGPAALPSAVPNGGSLLMFARTPWAVDRLIAVGVPVDLPDRWGATPVASLSRLGSEGLVLVRQLVAGGATARAEDYARLGDRATVEALTELDPAAGRSDAVMMAAVDAGHLDLARWLHVRGGSVNARAEPPSRHTALHAAAWNGNLAMAQWLVGAGADVAARDDEHRGTPRDWAEAAIDVRHDPACRLVADYLAGLERPGPPDGPGDLSGTRA
jgi:ankyrin repeat protein